MKTFTKKRYLLLLVIIFAGINTFAQPTYTTTYTTGAANWQAPAGVTSAIVECIGGGGGGGNGTSTSLAGGSGGGGGAHANSVLTVTPGTNYAYTVGAGGANGNPGSTGGNSTFGTGPLIRAAGGVGGAVNGGTAGIGGTIAASIGTNRFSGGDGFAQANLTPFPGGGGGSSAGTAANGVTATSETGATAPAGGGDGGNGGSGTGVAGSIGVAPGGGGGGGGRRSGGGTNGANGARGQVSVTYTGPYAGPDQSITACGTTATLAGNTAGTGATGTWTVVSGTATITSPNSPTSGVTGITPNSTVTLRWTWSQAGAPSHSDDVVITSPPGPGCVTYCASAAGSTADEDIFNVSVGTLNNTSTCATTGGAGSILNRYSNFTAVAPPTLSIGSTVNWSVEIGTCGATPYGNGLKIFIDFNSNGVLNDAGEEVYVSAATTAGAHTESGSFVVPAGATVGNTRMRVISIEGTIATVTGVTPCSAYSWGETEDYTVTICPEPTEITPYSFGMCSGGSTVLSASAGYLTIQWQSAPAATGPWTNVSGTSTYTTPALTSTTYYRAVTTPACMGNSNIAVVAIAPFVTAQPISTTACPNTNTSFVVETGSSTSTYQWQVSTNGGGVWNDITAAGSNPAYSGYTTDELILTNVVSGNSGYQYRCRVGDCSATINSNAAILTVAAAAGGTVTPASTSGACGSPVSVTLNLGGGATGGTQWQSSPDNSVWSDIFGATSSTYDANASTTTYFRTVQTVSGCTPAYSTTATVTVTGTSTKTWIGAAGGAWTTAANWSPSGVPGQCNNVVINTGASVVCAVSATTSCNNLTIASGATLSITTTKDLYINIYGNLTNNGTILQDAISTAITSGPNTGKCQSCSGIQFMGSNTTWGGTGTYTDLTVTIGDNSLTTMIGDATIHFLNCTKTSVVGTLNLGAKILKITSNFAQSGSEIHVNTGYLWIAITNSMLIDINTLYPEYGTCFWDLAGAWGISGGWASIGGTGFYHFEQRSPNAGNIIENQCNHLCRSNFKVWPGAGTVRFQASGNRILQVKGDFINEGTFLHNPTNTVLMNGPGLVYDSGTNTFESSSVPQNITGPSVTAFTNLTINNSSNGAQLNGVDASVCNTTTTGVLTLTSGPLFLNSQRLTIIRNATTAVTRTSGYVVSETNLATNPSIMQWNMASATGAHVFPFGAVDGSYIPVTFNNSGVVGNVSISTRPTAAADNQPWATGVTNMVGMGTNVTTAADRWWDVTSSEASPLPAVALTLSYRGAENSTTTSPTDTRGVQHWNSTSSCWDDGKNGGCGTVTTSSNAGVTASVGTVAVTGITYFSPFVVVRAAAPLPVTLLSFSALPNKENVLLNWQTASEINNEYFTVERSKDGTEFEPVATVKSKAPNGNSSVELDYNDNDMKPHKGISYYRLKQTDFDGKFAYSDIVAVNFKENEVRNLYVFPNPANSKLNIVIGETPQSIVKIYDMIGQVVLENIICNQPTGICQLEIESLPKGVYFVSLNDGDLVRHAKFIKD